MKEGADAPEAAAGSCVSSEQPAAPAGCGLMAELSKSQQKSRKRTDGKSRRQLLFVMV